LAFVLGIQPTLEIRSDQKVGLDQTLIVLSADHGAPEAPAHMAGLGMSTGRFAFDWFKTQSPLTRALQQRFGRADLIASHSHPYHHLNPAALAAAGVEVEEVERFVAEGLMKIPGSAYAMTRSDLLAGNGVPAQKIGRRVAPTNIAPVLAAYLGVKPPSGSVGSVLTEVLP
jgi:hypothetical protein